MSIAAGRYIGPGKQVSEHVKPYLELEVEQACTRAVNTPSRVSEAEQPLCTANAL